MERREGGLLLHSGSCYRTGGRAVLWGLELLRWQPPNCTESEGLCVNCPPWRNSVQEQCNDCWLSPASFSRPGLNRNSSEDGLELGASNGENEEGKSSGKTKSLPNVCAHIDSGSGCSQGHFIISCLSTTNRFPRMPRASGCLL